MENNQVVLAINPISEYRIVGYVVIVPFGHNSSTNIPQYVVMYRAVISC